jgi:hypothetical protein
MKNLHNFGENVKKPMLYARRELTTSVSRGIMASM